MPTSMIGSQFQPVRPSFIAAAVAGALAACLAGPGMAQTAPPAESEAGIEQIIVTAQRRSESLEDVPISIASVSAEVLESSGASRVTDLPQLVPGLRLDQSGAFAQPTIRGIGSAVAGPGLSVNVATYIDGFYIPNSLTTDLQLISVSDVQVLKGPQGTLFGRNATGGAIMVNTLDPSQTSELRVNQSWERFNHTTTGLYANSGITDTLAINFAGFYDRGDGFLNDVVFGGEEGKFENFGLRTKLLWEPTDAMKFILAFAHTEIDDPTNTAKNSYEGLSSGNVRGFYSPSERGDVANDYNTVNRTNSNSYYLTAEFGLGFATLKSYSQYRDEKTLIHNDNDSSSGAVIHSNYTAFDESFSQEFNLASEGDGRFTWLAGLYYFDSDVKYPAVNVSFLGGPFNNTQDSTNTTEAYAAYGDATYQLLDSLYVTGGLRYSSEKGKVSLKRPVIPVMELEETWTSTDPRLTVRYEFGDNSNVYASYSQGFKAGQLPPGNRPLSIVDPESVDAYEIGYKTVGSRIRFDAAAFYYDYQDLQVTAFLSPGSIVRNAASAEIYGADASLTWDLTDTLTLRAGTAYTHGEYQDFDDAVRFVQSPTSGFFSVQTVDASGNVMQRTPEWTGNLDLTYTKPFERGTLQLGGNLYATSEIFFDPVEQFSQDSYQLLNLRATWTTPNDAMSFSVFGTNVTDEVYRNQVQPATGAVQQGYGEPRSVGLQLTFRL